MEQLESGLSMARLLRTRDWSGATFSAFLPTGLPDDRAHAFDQPLGMSPPPHRSLGSSVVIQPVERATGATASLLVSECVDPGDACLIEDQIVSAIDARTVRPELCWLTRGAELYYVLQKGSTLLEAERALDAGTAFPTVAVATSVMEGSTKCGGELSDHALHQLVDSARIVVVGAYDREGYVIAEWHRGSVKR
jgi:hypothetical protein